MKIAHDFQIHTHRLCGSDSYCDTAHATCIAELLGLTEKELYSIVK